MKVVVMSQTRWPREGRLVGLVTLLFLAAMEGSGRAQQEEVVAAGKREYQWYCEFCHGAQGKGDGPMVQDLVVKPADLTQIRKRNGGQYPLWRLYRIIEGREAVKGHGGGAMPLWGPVFARQEGATDPDLQEQGVRGRILSLVYYLESIQEE
jgi:mono/diheme cytochrome c family protein